MTLDQRETILGSWERAQNAHIDAFFDSILAQLERGFQEDVLRILQGLPAAQQAPVLVDAEALEADSQ